MNSLFKTQTWIQENILKNVSVSKTESEQYLKETPSFSHETRWHIYQYAIWERQFAAIEKDLPATAKLIGQEAFRKLLSEYLRIKPSRYPSLSHLGQHLSEFARTSDWIERYPWLADFVAFEYALLCMEYVEQPCAPIASEKLALLNLISAEKLKFKMAQDLILLTCEYPVSEMLEVLLIKPKRPECLAVFSRDFEGYHKLIDKIELEALRAAQAGAPLLEILEIFNNYNMLPEKVFEVFQSWMSNHWIKDIVVID